MSLDVALVDAALDAADSDGSGDGDVSEALCGLLDEHGTWEGVDDDDRNPALFAVVESSGAWWFCSRGAGGSPEAIRFASEEEAEAAMAAAQVDYLSGPESWADYLNGAEP